MKYLLKWRIIKPPKDDEEQKARRKENEKRQDEKKYGKVLYPPHMIGNYKGFVIVDCTYEQLRNRITLVNFLEYEVLPILPVPDIADGVANR